MTIRVVATCINSENDSFPKHHVFEGDQIIIGRSPSNDLCLEDPTLSAVHAKIVASNDPSTGKIQLFVQDLGSSNGTSIEQSKVTPFYDVALPSNQWLRLGQCLLKASLITDEALEAAEATGSEIKIASATSERPMPIFNLTEEQIDEPVQQIEATTSEPTEDIYEVSSETLLIKDEISVKDETPVSGSLSSYSGTILNSNISDLNFAAQKMVIIGGSITMDGKPVTNVRVDGGELGVTFSDSYGRFNFGPILEGSAYEIKVSHSEHNFECDTISGTITEETTLEFKCLSTYSINGRITHNGKPLADVELDAGSLGKVTTDSDGYYVFSNVPANTNFNIQISKVGFAFSKI